MELFPIGACAAGFSAPHISQVLGECAGVIGLWNVHSAQDQKLRPVSVAATIGVLEKLLLSSNSSSINMTELLDVVLSRFSSAAGLDSFSSGADGTITDWFLNKKGGDGGVIRWCAALLFSLVESLACC